MTPVILRYATIEILWNILDIRITYCGYFECEKGILSKYFDKICTNLDTDSSL